MLLLSVSEFRSNIAKYLKMAMTERIAIKSPAGIFDITPSQDIRVNPSPSGDTWYDVPENMAHLEAALERSAQRDPSELISLNQLKERYKAYLADV